MPCGPTCAFVPVVVDMAWPALSSAIASAMANLGYQVALNQNAADTTLAAIELDVGNSQGFEASLGESEELMVNKGAVSLAFRRGADGRLKVRASGLGMGAEELKAAAAAAVNGFLQAYVRQRVSSELRKQGFSIREEKLADGSIRLLAKKWG